MIVMTIVMLMVMKATLIEEGAADGKEPVEIWRVEIFFNDILGFTS